MHSPGLVIFEDEHLLVVNKPAGWNTHSPAPYAGEGIYDWLRHRDPRWHKLAIIHRLDKETSGVLVFSKSSPANRSLTEQFTERAVQKRYRFLASTPIPPDKAVQSSIVRDGEKYCALAVREGEPLAETRFFGQASSEGIYSGIAEPLTGKTHQIRVHAASLGFPILGDKLYGGKPWQRVALHASEISFQHPVTGESLHFKAPVDWEADPHIALRQAAVLNTQTDSCRLLHGTSDLWAGVYVDKLGPHLLWQSEEAPTREGADELLHRTKAFPTEGFYWKKLARQLKGRAEGGPEYFRGPVIQQNFPIQENGLLYECSFDEGYSVGLFLDQRDNRRRVLTQYVAANFPLITSPMGNTPEVLNTFCYTCGFSVCAAQARMHTTSLDLSKNYLEWGKRNFTLNGLNPEEHDFIYGDVFDWLGRFAKKSRKFDLILLDPPTFSRSEEGVFQAEKNYGELAKTAIELLSPGGVLFASTNASRLPPEAFLNVLHEAAYRAGRKVEQEHYVPQPIDFPITRAEPAYLKTVWQRMR